MADTTSSGPRRTAIVIAVVLLLLVGLFLARCHSREAAPAAGTAANPAPIPSPTPTPTLRAGLEVVNRDPAAGLLTIHDRGTGETIQIRTAEATPETIEAAIAAQVKARARTPTPSPVSQASAPAAVTLAFVPNPTPTPTSPPTAGGVAPALPSPSPTPRPPESSGLPSYVPQYPGATTVTLSGLSEKGSAHGAYVFTTSDLPDKVGSFYAQKVTESGLTVIVNVAGTDKNGATFTLIAEDAATSRSLSLTAAIEDGRTRGSIEFTGR